MSKVSTFSIIIPVYNSELYLEKCIDSVLSQTYEDYELLLVDDGSPDRCPKMCDELSEKDSRIKVIHKKNGGQSSARNVGLDNAIGKYLVFMDSDDYWCDSTLLQDLHKRIVRFQEDMVLYGCKIEHENGTCEITRSKYAIDLLNNHDKQETLDSLYSQGNFPGSAWIYIIKRSIIEDNHIRFTEGVSAEDFEWVVNSLVLSKTIGAIDGVQYVYVKHDGSVTTKAKYSHINGALKSIERYYELGKKYNALDKFLARVYLLAIMSFNSLTLEDKRRAIPDLNKYITILKESRQSIYYWFIRLFGLRLSSYAIGKAYKTIR